MSEQGVVVCDCGHDGPTQHEEQSGRCLACGCDGFNPLYEFCWRQDWPDGLVCVDCGEHLKHGERIVRRNIQVDMTEVVCWTCAHPKVARDE